MSIDIDIINTFGGYTRDKMIFILPCRGYDAEENEYFFRRRWVNRKYQLKLTRNGMRMVRDGLFTVGRAAGSTARTKKYRMPGQTYLELTEKGKEEYFRLKKLYDKKMNKSHH